MRDFFQKRMDRARAALGPSSAMFVNDARDVRYLSGFSGDSSSLFITSGNVYFLTDGRYTEQIKNEAMIGLQVLEAGNGTTHLDLIGRLLNEHAVKTLLVRKKDINLEFYEKLGPALEARGAAMENTDVIGVLRMRKDRLEIELIRENLMLTELAFSAVIRLVEKGKKESDIAAELEYYLKRHGAFKTSFDTIVASGWRSALPHGTAAGKTIEENEIVLFDFGVENNGYCSDFTRCYYYGPRKDPKIIEIHGIVKEALLQAEAVVKPGVRARDIHQKAFDVISGAGYADCFRHSTGHGVGLDIHEQPAISFNNDCVIEEGMVFTVEPGIYLPGLGGVRLEDMVVVTQDGCEVMTTTPYDL